MNKKSQRLNTVVRIGILWGLGITLLIAILEPTPENLTLLVSIYLSGFYTILLSISRKLWLPALQKKPLTNGVLLGSINAAIVETLFLIIEKIFGAEGVAAHPNLIIDLIMTMPWYIGMVWIFVRVQNQEKFPGGIVLLLGGLYELGADGIIGGIIAPAIMGQPVIIWQTMILLVLIAFWQFIPVYSSIVLPPAWILADTEPTSRQPRWRRGLLPLLWLLPFFIYLVLVMLVISLAGL
jgi:hypothetical protein